MVALAEARSTDSRNLKDPVSYPMAVDIIYAGSLVRINAAGFLAPAAAEASTGGCVGVAFETVDNSGGSAGDLRCDVQEGHFRFAATSIVQGDVGAVMFASDDQTFDETQGANEPIAGKLVEFLSATEGVIAVGLAHSS